MTRPTNISYRSSSGSGNEGASGEPGGDVLLLIANGALKVGDYVYFDSTVNKVIKSATAANYANKQAGVVIGGRATFGRVVNRSADIGIAAAADGQEVLVQYNGIAWVVADGAITLGTACIPSAATAGKVTSGTTATQVLGNVLDTAAADGDKVRVLIRPR